jgi:MFS family permease
MLLGGLIGGWLSDNMSRRKAVSLFLLGFVFFVSILGLMPLMDFFKGPLPYFIAFGGMYLCVGMFTSSSYALFMDQTNPKIGATQFSTYMAATNGCEAWAIWTAGKLTGTWDYSTAFLIMCVVSLFGMYLLKYVKPSEN